MSPVKKPRKKALIGPQYFQNSSPGATNAAPTKPIGLNNIDNPPLSAAMPPFTMLKRAGIPVSRSANPPMLFDRALIAVPGEVKAPSTGPTTFIVSPRLLSVVLVRVCIWTFRVLSLKSILTQDWIIARAEHVIGGNGFTMKMELEAIISDLIVETEQ